MQHGPVGQQPPTGQHDAFFAVVLTVVLRAAFTAAVLAATPQHAPSWQQEPSQHVTPQHGPGQQEPSQQADFAAVVVVVAVVQQSPVGQQSPSGQHDALTVAVPPSARPPEFGRVIARAVPAPATVTNKAAAM